METKLRKTMRPVLGLVLCTQLAGLAGQESAPVQPPPNNGDFCSWLSNKPGTLYKDSSNPYLQEFQIEGRYQYQAGYLDGSDVNGDDFHNTFDEHRRFRLGARAKFLNYFGFKAVLNLVGDDRPQGGDLDWGYQDFDEAVLSFDLGKAMGGAGPFDSLVLNYGREKFVLSQEARTSSTRLLTVERSALSNKVYGSARPTGLSVDAKSGDWSFGGAIYNAGRDGGNNGFLSGWHGDQIYYGTVGYKASDRLNIRFDAVYNDSDFGADSEINYRWATSLNADYNTGPWGVIGDLIIGDNGGAGNGVPQANRQDTFWGVIVMPYAWIVDEKLQGVFQYQYASSSADNGIRVNSRYGRAGKNTPPANVNGGRGDSHHSLYAGLNYYLCGHNAKIQMGVEYQTMDTPIGDFDTLTYLVGFRTFF
jgi:hypothetical protein